MAKCLNFHAAYRCHRSGACCTSGWTIPFNAQELLTATALPLVSGTLARTEGGATAVMRGHRCSFLETGEDGIHACEIHRVGGHAALPLTCRMFPRIVLHDPRGTFISLSHFCPTAAAMLFEPGPPAEIVDAPAALAGSEPLDGLDARDVWPPLLRSGLMMDLESYSAWERLGIQLLAREAVAPAAALDALETATTTLSTWTPAQPTSLLDAVHDTFATVAPRPGVPVDHDAAVKRWLAARLFGAWIAYQGDGLRTIVSYLRACLDTFRVELARDGRALEAIRRADHLIIHESSSQQLANLLNARS